MLAELVISPHTTRLLDLTTNGYIRESDIRRSFGDIRKRCEAFLGAMYQHYFLRVFRPGSGKGGFAYLPIKWGETPRLPPGYIVPSHNNHQQLPVPARASALLEVIDNTTDPQMLSSMIKETTEETWYSLLHPEFQRKWYENLKGAEAKQEFRSVDPEVQYHLSRRGQMEFFVKKALDTNVDTKTQIQAMAQAGKLQGFYSEKMQLIHENAGATNIQQNFIMGTELTNRFRLFMEDRLKGRKQLDEPTPDTTDEAELIEAAPVTDDLDLEEMLS